VVELCVGGSSRGIGICIGFAVFFYILVFNFITITISV